MKKSKNISKRKRKDLDDDDPLAGDRSDIFDQPYVLVRFERVAKTKTITFRISADLLDHVKLRAAQMDINYQKLIRLALEEFLAKSKP